MTEDTVAYIRQNLTQADLWGQLAEECCELAQAALKMQRICNGENAPRMSPEDCLNAVIEEHADVCGCFRVLDWHDKAERQAIMNEKLNRWANHITALKEEGKKWKPEFLE